MAAQRMIFSLVIAAAVAALAHSATADVKNLNRDPARERTRRHILPADFLDFVKYMTSFFTRSSSIFNRPQSPSSPRKAALKALSRKQPPQTVEVVHSPEVLGKSSTICDPPCAHGRQCCLRKPGSAFASCQNVLLSGSECGWNHYSGRNPSTTVAIQNRATCPCLLGMACVSATQSKPGVCTFF